VPCSQLCSPVSAEAVQHSCATTSSTAAWENNIPNVASLHHLALAILRDPTGVKPQNAALFQALMELFGLGHMTLEDVAGQREVTTSHPILFRSMSKDNIHAALYQLRQPQGPMVRAHCHFKVPARVPTVPPPTIMQQHCMQKLLSAKML
jgi:hypothetical protein